MAFYGGWNPYSIKTSSKNQPVSLFGCTSSVYRYSLKSYPSVDDASPKKFGHKNVFIAQAVVQVREWFIYFEGISNC